MYSFVTRLPSENSPNSYYRVKVLIASKSFAVSIACDSSAFKGNVDEDYITKQSKILNICEDEYIEEFRRAMSSNCVYTYAVSDGYFNVKKFVKTGISGIKVKFCAIKLIEADFKEIVLDILDTTLAENQEFFIKDQKLRDETKTLTERDESIVRQFEDLQKAKNTMENALYCQFLNILNSKKRKIRELEQKLGLEVEDDIISEDNKDGMDVDSKDPDEVFDIDTDVDEEPLEMKTTIEEVTKIENETVDKKKWNIEDFLNSEAKEPGGSNVQNILNAMSFLDPTVPFVA